MAKSFISTRPVSTFETKAARVSLASGVLFVLILASLHLLEPEFHPTWRFISEYTLGRFGWLMPLAFVALALSLASAEAVIFSQVRTTVGYIGLVVLALGVAGFLIAAAFKTDPISTSPENLTFSGKMHVLGASLDYSPVAFLLLSFSLARNQAWRPVQKQLFIVAGIALALTVAFILLIPQDGRFGPGVFTGLIGRFLIVSYLGWVAATTLYAIKLYKQQIK